LVMNQNVKREENRKAQKSNITAGVTVANIVRSTLGPKAMLKMLLDPMGGIVLTNDGNAILREIDVTHPTAKSMMELSRAQDEEVGDGTTSVIILAGEMMGVAEPLLDIPLHPTVIVQSYLRALEDSIKIMEELSTPLDTTNQQALSDCVRKCVDTKFVSRYGSKISDLAVRAAQIVQETIGGKKVIDMKRYARVEKIPGGSMEDCEVLEGVMFNKDIVHPKMRRRIEKPRVILLDCTLEYKKSESATNVEITREEDWELLLKQEEDEVQKMCEDILKHKPDVVVTEKGVSDLAQHFLLKGNVSVIRRARKTDNNRIARVTGATIVNRTDEITEKDVGTKCGLFKVEKIGDEYFTYMLECEDPKACTVLLRGASKDALNEIERNLQDAFCVARNIFLEPRLVPGGGAVEMEVSARLLEKSRSMEGGMQYGYKAVAAAFEVIPRVLAMNCGVNVVRVMTELRSKHAKAGEGVNIGIDAEKGVVVDVRDVGVMDTFVVKQQCFKSAIESAAMLLRIDQVVSGLSRKKGGGGAAHTEMGAGAEEMMMG